MTQPTSPQDRIIILDILRGFALLGILLMNIQAFAMISAAYENPSLVNITNTDKWVWIICHAFAESKFMAIFSLLFGAGIILIRNRLEEKKENVKKIYFRRNFLLMIIGLLHAYLIWHGDILFTYALCGFFLYYVSHLPSKKLFMLGSTVVIVPTIISLLLFFSISHFPPEEIDSLKASWTPSQEVINQETYVWQQGTWQEQLALRSEFSLYLQTIVFFMYSLWWASGWMLLGMGFFKTGFLTGEKNQNYYLKLSLHCGAIGFILILAGVNANLSHGFSFEYSFILGSLWNYLGTIPLAISYVSFIIWLSKKPFGKIMQKTLACVGKLSLTNYLMQSIICSIIFYSFGFALFGKLTRLEQLFTVVLIWIAQIIFSVLWLRLYKFGPAEYLWRRLTYGKGQR